MKKLLKILGGSWPLLKGKKERLSEESFQAIILACVQMKLGRCALDTTEEEIHLDLMRMFIGIAGHDCLSVSEIRRASESFKMWLPKIVNGKLI